MFYYNRTAKNLKPLEAGDVVFVRPVGRSKEWKRATVNKAVGIRSYVVTTDQGIKIGRNRRHLRLASNEQLLPNTVGAGNIELHINQPKSTITDSDQIDQPDQLVRSNQIDHPDQLVKSRQINQPDVATRSVTKDNSSDGSRVSPLRNVSSPIRYTSRGRILRRPVYLKDYDCNV